MDYKKVTQHIVNWLNDYIKELPINGFIIGMSGGIDSALVSILCAQTGKKVHLVNLSIHQNITEYNRAQNQINSLLNAYHNVEALTIDLSSTFDELVLQMPLKVQEDPLSLANARSRLRMTTLYAIGQTNKLLVTGTGNKVEDFGIGFFTKYGDGGVDINPIGDLFKSEVFKLAKHLGVIEEILTAKPTDGLWDDNRSDEDQIGATYEELEFIMNYTGDKEKLSKREKEVLEIFNVLHGANQHKLKPIPICDLSEVK